MNRLIALAPFAALIAGPALAQQVAATPPASQIDRQFVTEAASGGLAEVEQARMAEQKAQNDAVKSFARQMSADHSKANEQLAAIASQEGLNPPRQPAAKEKAATERLSKLNGAAFDRTYAQEEVKDHKETIALFEKEAKSGQDPKLKAFAAETLPTLQRHLQLAQQIGAR